MKSKTLRIYFFTLALLIGLIHMWELRYFIESDGIPYLDIADEVVNGNWKALVNGTWSPLYAAIIAFFFYIFKPNPFIELAFVHCANFFIYLIALLCFSFFLNQLVIYTEQKRSSLSENALRALGYSLFIWSSMNLITISQVTPDMLVSAFIYLVFGILLKIKSQTIEFPTFFLLGIILGLGYLSKEAMFVLAFIFLIASIFAASNFKKGLFYMLIALIGFSLVATPFILILSKSRGHFTYGETGKLNYHWYANRNVCNCFEPGFPGCNEKLIHPIKEIFHKPTVFEYSAAFANATYPPTYDPSYWCDGSKSYFDLKGQIRAILESAKEYFNLFFKYQGALTAAFLILFFMSSKRRLGLKEEWLLLLPTIAAMAMYSLVHVEARYIGAFIVIFWLGLFSALRLPESKEMKKIVSVLITVLSAFMIITSLFSSDLLEGREIIKELKINWKVASGLKEAGLKEKDKVGVVGIYDDYYWARLAKTHIVAEIPGDDEINVFWSSWTSNNFTKSKVIETFKTAGAKMIVAGRVPAYASTVGWRNIKNTPYYFYIL